MIPDRPKFLILKTSALGDIIHSFPVVAYLKKRFPGCSIDWVVEKKNRELVDAHPMIDQVIEFDQKDISSYLREIKKRSYDIAFDLQGNIKSGLLLSCIKAQHKVGFGYRTVSEWPNILFTNRRYNPPAGQNIRSDYLYLVSTFIGDKNQPVEEVVQLKKGREVDSLLPKDAKEAILIAPGARWKNKQLPLNKLVEFLSKQEGYFLFCFGSTEEEKLTNELAGQFKERATLLPKLDLPSLQNLMGKVSLVVAMDSLPLHLAGTTQTPTISFFGSSNPAKYRPMGEQHTSFFGICPYGVTFKKRCPKLRNCKTGVCMENIKYE